MDALAKALAVLWGKINAALGRSQAEQARDAQTGRQCRTCANG